MMDAENIEEGDMDADLLLSQLLDEEADVDTLESSGRVPETNSILTATSSPQDG